ncbi:MAG TPA: hypothetical protein ENI41_03080, partial [Deltaproteobacteria bacterium]|nr:hypothetical protein [Deltaproteobacteria bacterium]
MQAHAERKTMMLDIFAPFLSKAAAIGKATYSGPVGNEPSMEVEVFWNGKWMELGGSGIFRPEVTLPAGVKNPVLAWGLGLERLAMLKLGLTDIRTLYMSDLRWLR